MVALDTRTPVDAAVRPRRRALAIVAGLNAFAAWFGGVALIVGGIDFGDRLDGRLPLDSVVIAGLALATVVAVPLTVLAWAAWSGSPRTDGIALIAGVLLMGWIVVQIAFLRSFSPFQPVYLAVGVYFVAASHRVDIGVRLRGALLVVVGAIAAAVGVGLLPYVAASGVSVPAGMSVVMLIGGLALAVDGARRTLRGVGRVRAIAGGLGVVVMVGVVAWLIAPGVAATHVPPTRNTSTPERVGLHFEAITITTDDGVDLAAWYLPGTTRRGVVVIHGAGSTRSDALDEAVPLVRNGDAVLLIDSRGHGDSGGTAMDFGWYGDLDITAAVEYLASQRELDPTRIGVLGLSMGGEEAIGAAAADPRIAAVVAEGATARRSADKGWYSDVYGWRGWLQEQFERIQFGITDFLTDASPPTPLRSAVAAADDTQFLLITAGHVADERHAARDIRAAAPDRVRVWEVAGADHTGGHDTRPEEWERRVIEFFDESLGRPVDS